MLEIFTIYREMRDFGDGRWLSVRMALCLRIFGCYPVYREFFLPGKPSLLARIVIWRFFGHCSNEGIEKVAEYTDLDENFNEIKSADILYYKRGNHLFDKQKPLNS